MNNKHIALLATGGTIASLATASGAVPSLSADALASRVARTESIVVRTRDVLRVPSRTITPADMWTLAVAVREEIEHGADGVVITHGTDTMEETAYALALLLETSVPVVLTGAMRLYNEPGSDGPANLAAALAAAASPRLAAYGPVVVHQDEIHTARWVTKVFSTRVAAFASPGAGPVGFVVEGRIVLLHGPPPIKEALRRIAAPDRRVEVIWALTGADGVVVDAVAAIADGIVVAGTGGGHASPPLAAALARVVHAGRPVVVASRCVGGYVLRETYSGPGSDRDLKAAGVLSAGSLSPVKARLRLLFGLSAGETGESLFDDLP